MFVRGGNVNPGNYLGDAGSEGLYWSSASYSKSYAHGLRFLAGGIIPSSGSYGRSAGFSIRCVALGG